jgi:uncharacterized protein YdcH (DUF465 family)
VKTKLLHIKEQFPDQNHAIDLLMAEDPEFLSLCEDHDDCVNVIHYWVNSKEPEAEARVREYRALVRDLEEEIIQVLVAIEPGRSD